MFSVSLYTFTKKKNSTARPSTPALVESGEIKEDFTPLAFEMTFSFSTKSQIPPYNYAYIADFGRYYYITDWVFVGGLWRGSFAVDVLASYKTEILASNQFVARAADSSAMQAGLIDTSYPTISGSNRGLSGDVTVQQSAFWGLTPNANSDIFESGTIILGCIGNTDKNVGCLTYYALSVDGFNVLMNSLLDDISWANISVSEISTNLQKALIDPFQYVASVCWLPIDDLAFIGSSGAPSGDIVQSIRLGWWDFSIAPTYYARILHNPSTFGWDYIRRKSYIALDKHPQSNSRGAWLELSPYSRYVFTFLPFGRLELDSAELYGFEYLGIEVLLHSYTGDAVLNLYAAHDNQGTSDKHILTLNANVGVPLPVGQISLNMGNMDSMLTSAALMGASEIAQQLSGSSTEQVTTQKGPAAHSQTSRTSRTR